MQITRVRQLYKLFKVHFADPTFTHIETTVQTAMCHVQINKHCAGERPLAGNEGYDGTCHISTFLYEQCLNLTIAQHSVLYALLSVAGILHTPLLAFNFRIVHKSQLFC